MGHDHVLRGLRKVTVVWSRLTRDVKVCNGSDLPSRRPRSRVLRAHPKRVSNNAPPFRRPPYVGAPTPLLKPTASVEQGGKCAPMYLQNANILFPVTDSERPTLRQRH
jgi:hypothetical protein